MIQVFGCLVHCCRRISGLADTIRGAKEAQRSNSREFRLRRRPLKKSNVFFLFRITPSAPPLPSPPRASVVHPLIGRSEISWPGTEPLTSAWAHSSLSNHHSKDWLQLQSSRSFGPLPPALTLTLVLEQDHLAPHARLENRNWVESSKVAALLLELENLCSVGSKSILFSQWTAFLDLLQIPLSRSNISFVRLDGTLNQQQREKVIKQFSEESHILVLLMSLKAGGVGINLMAASHAFVLDPWWNPAVEEQAVMRIHRIGQTKRVMIKRFIAKGTIQRSALIASKMQSRATWENAHCMATFLSHVPPPKILSL